MAEPAIVKRPYTIQLAQSINTDTPDGDIRPFNGPAPHLRNTGIERFGGISSAYEDTAAIASGRYCQYTLSGKKVEVKNSTAEVFINSTQINQSLSGLGKIYSPYVHIKLPGEPIS